LEGVAHAAGVIFPVLAPGIVWWLTRGKPEQIEAHRGAKFAFIGSLGLSAGLFAAIAAITIRRMETLAAEHPEASILDAVEAVLQDHGIYWALGTFMAIHAVWGWLGFFRMVRRGR
jgi:hypothetical protein